MQICLSLQAFSDELGFKDNRRKDIGVGMKSDDRAATADLAYLFQSGNGLTTRELLLPFDSAPFDPGHQAIGQCSHHRRANSMQPAGVRIVEPVKLAAGMQSGENE